MSAIHVPLDVIQGVINGDERSFKTLFDQLKTRIYTIAFHLTKSEFGAEEVTQELFLDIWRYRDRFENVKDPGGYIYTMVVNSAASFHKKQIKIELIKRTHSEDLADNRTMDNILLKEDMKLLDQYIDKMPPKRRLIYILKKKEELTTPQIAAVLGISEHTVKNQLKEAVKTLRASMSFLRTWLL